MAVDKADRAGAVLVVDDVPVAAAVVTEILESAGYGVHVAHNIETAVEIAVTHPIDVVLSDVVLGPSGDGLDLAERLAEWRPSVPVIFMSGYAKLPGGPLEDDPILAKPFTAEALLSHVAKALARA